MQVLTSPTGLPVYSIIPDKPFGSKHFKVYHFEGAFPDHADFLIPHRKDHYLIAFIRKASTRHWVDMRAFESEDNTIFFIRPDQIIVKEEYKQLWSTAIAFTPAFLAMQENTALTKLPIIQNPQNGNVLHLTDTDILFIEDVLSKIRQEYDQQMDYQQSMLSAYLTVLLTYLSRLYTLQYQPADNPPDKQLLRLFQERINQHYHEYHEVGDYASLLHLSAGHLSDVVREQSGKSAIKHIHERLIMEARRLLVHTNNSLKDIAYDLGFSDASYFNRFFKRETGITPASYREQIREMYH